MPPCDLLHSIFRRSLQPPPLPAAAALPAPSGASLQSVKSQPTFNLAKNCGRKYLISEQKSAELSPALPNNSAAKPHPTARITRPNATKPLLFCCVHCLPKIYTGCGQPMNAYGLAPTKQWFCFVWSTLLLLPRPGKNIIHCPLRFVNRIYTRRLPAAARLRFCLLRNC